MKKQYSCNGFIYKNNLSTAIMLLLAKTVLKYFWILILVVIHSLDSFTNNPSTAIMLAKTVLKYKKYLDLGY